MQKILTAALAGAFATASSFAMLAYGAQHPATGHPQFLSAAATIAYADDENNAGGNRDNDNDNDDNGNRNNNDENGNGNKHGNNGNHGNSGSAHNCTNPAGHQRGWCKHQGENNGNGKHRNRGGNSTISGTVTSVNGNLATVQLDNGGSVVVNENGTQLNVGQHYNLTGCYSNNQFMLNCNNNNNNNGNQYGNQSVNGTIMSIGNGTVTLLGVPPVTINVQQAVNNNATNGALTIGRSITAYGYYSNNVFYATRIQ